MIQLPWSEYSFSQTKTTWVKSWLMIFLGHHPYLWWPGHHPYLWWPGRQRNRRRAAGLCQGHKTQSRGEGRGREEGTEEKGDRGGSEEGGQVYGE